MFIDIKIFCSLLLLFAPVWAYGQNAAHDSLETLESLLRVGAVPKVEILRIPDEVLTRTSVTPEAVHSIAYYSVIFRKDVESTFGPLLSESSFRKSSQQSDLRWGVLFYDNSDQEIGSMFVDKFGESGFVNGEAGRFGSNLARRVLQIIRNLR